jgi:hypothetical protein
MDSYYKVDVKNRALVEMPRPKRKS